MIKKGGPGGGAVGKMLDSQAWGPKFNPSYHMCQSDSLPLPPFSNE